MKNSKLPAFFLLLAAQQLVFLLFFPPFLEPDSHGYISLASGALSNDTRLPGYPLFLHAVYSVFGPGNLPVIVFQHLLGLLLWFIFARLLETDRQKTVFSALYFCDLLFNSYQHAILSDFLFSFFVCLSAWSAWLYARDRRRGWLFLCGLLVACGIMTKPALRLFPFFILPLFLADRQPFKRRLAAAAVFLAAPLLAVNLWSFRNYAARGYYALLPMESFHYIGRVVSYIEFPENSVTREYFIKALPARVTKDLRSPAVYAAVGAMQAAGIKNEVMDAELRRVFRLSILRHPFRYLEESGIELFYFFFSAHNLYAKFGLADRLPASAEAGLRSGDIRGTLLKVLLSLHPFYWALFLLLAWFAAANARRLARERDFFLLYVYGLIAYTALVSSMANDGLARYRCAVQPLIVFIAALALSGLLRTSGTSSGGGAKP